MTTVTMLIQSLSNFVMKKSLLPTICCFLLWQYTSGAQAQFIPREVADKMNREASARFAKQYEEESERNAQHLARLAEIEQHYQQAMQAAETDESFFWGHKPQIGWGGGSPSNTNTMDWHSSLSNTPNEPLLHGRISTTLQTLPRKKCNDDLSALFNTLESQLIHLHETNQLGSFDIDKYSERLLEIKNNYAVMIKHSGQVSSRQATVLSNELSKLHTEIAHRAISM